MDITDNIRNTICSDFRDVCNHFREKIDSVDEAHRDALRHELAIVDQFIEAVEKENDIFGYGWPITIEYAHTTLFGAVTGLLEKVAAGTQGTRRSHPPVHDDACYYPGCETYHAYGHGNFNEHCDSCHAWLSVNVHISILTHSETHDEIVTCSDCCDCEEYLEAGYTDDEGKLQRRRARWRRTVAHGGHRLRTRSN